MSNVLNPIVDLYQTQLDASRRLADIVFSGTEKIDRVVIEATHHAFTEQLNLAQALAFARDPKGVANLQATFFSRRPNSAVSYQKEVMRLFAEIQNEIGRSMQFYIEQLGANAASSAAAPLKAVQNQANDAVFNPITGIFSVWESAFREVASLANKNIEAARSSFENVANATENVADEAMHKMAGAAEDADSATAATAAAMAAAAEESKPHHAAHSGGSKRK